MGRPLGKKFFGNPSTSGKQLNVEAWIPGGSGAVAAWVVAQKSNTMYDVTDGTDTGRCKLQEDTLTGPGQMRIVVMPFGIDAATGTATMLAVGGTMNSTGTGYAVGDTLTVSGGTAATAATFNVDTIGVISGSVNAGGGGYTVSDVITVNGGTGTSASFTVATVGGSGEITGVTVQDTGNYTVSPGTTGIPVSGGTGSSALLDLTFGAITVSPATAGDYSVLPTNPVTTTGGSGTGALIDVDWGVLAIAVTAGGAGYTAAPAVTVAGSATATATLSGDAVGSVTVDTAGSGYTAVPAVTFDAPGGDAEYAKILNSHHVKTFQDVIYKWNKDKAASAKDEADLDFS